MDNSKTVFTEAFEEIRALCWSELARGAANRRHGFHHPTVATVGRDGFPRSRVVILRHADEMSGSLRFHTDVRSEKWRELHQNPAISMVLYDEQLRVQLRVQGMAQLHRGDGLAKTAWESAQPMSRVCYGIAPGPGVAIANGDDYQLPLQEDAAHVGFENFGAVVIHVTQIEWLYLKQSRNRRALFNLSSKSAQWLVP